MGKNLYSLMLTDEVVREIDRLALKQNTNRSNLINQILAEYVSYITPEKRINGIFKSIEEFMHLTDMIPYVFPHQNTMSLKSCLEYRYRPTIKYEVELFKNEAGKGRISVVFRTQSQELKLGMENFFRLWCYSEQSIRGNLHYTLNDGKFTRSISIVGEEGLTLQQVADAISEYIKMFDSCLKGFLSGSLNETDILACITEYCKKEVLV